MAESRPPSPLLFARLDAALSQALPASVISSDVTSYSVEAMLPAVVVKPATAEEAALALRVASDADAAVVPWGGGTRQTLGEAPRHYDVALDLRGLNRVIEYEPADLTVTVEAGMALSDLQAVLGENGQWLPLDPPLEQGATVGGMLATNASGPTRHRYGTARDLLIGVTFALPSGELAKSGGRVVKNVAGYDLGKLQIGALGTLGVITQATFKVAPLPLHTEIASATGTMSQVMSIIRSVTDALLAAQSFELHSAGMDQWRLQVGFAAGAAAVSRSVRDFESAIKDTGAALGSKPDATAPEPADWVGAPLIVRATVMPSTAGTICEAFKARGAEVLAYPTVGAIQAAFPASLSIDRLEAIRHLRQLCTTDGKGALVIEKAPTELKRAAGVWGEPRGDFDLMRRLKAELDPKSTLNPGRYLGGI